LKPTRQCWRKAQRGIEVKEYNRGTCSNYMLLWNYHNETHFTANVS
jgi:hypothetical protein